MQENFRYSQGQCKWPYNFDEHSVFYQGSRFFPPGVFYFIVLNSSLTLGERLLVRGILYRIRSKGYNKKYLLIIGQGAWAKAIQKSGKQNLGYEITGLIDDQAGKGKRIEGVEVIGEIAHLEEILDQYTVDEIIIALPLKEYDKLRVVIKQCEKSGVRAVIIPDYTRYIPARPAYDELDGLPLINIRHVPLDNLSRALAKRVFDVIASGLGLLICSPLLLAVAIAIKVESPGL